MIFSQALAYLQSILCWLLSGLSALSFLPLARWLPQNDATVGLFNRWSISYTSDAPLAGEISYFVGSCKKTESFFLEASENKATFSCYIDVFLDGVLARELRGVTLRVLGGEEAAYQLKDVALEWVKPPKNISLTIEDAFCSAGVNLRWGGALESFIWKAAPAGYGNLLNRHDEGRLVQQSYYGTEQPPYVPGNYNDTPWGYNPVQGGDQYGNRSRLVDYSFSDAQITIKSRPMDWSKNGDLTPSYMENIYMIENGVLMVENRFTDFSGMTHTARHQEMPAVYVVSALDTLQFYNGASPWTNGTLTQKSDLPFWGGNPESYFTFDAANTETWCAWTAGAQPGAFGVGVFNPTAELLIAGRHGTPGSKSPEDGATSYVAPLRTLALESFQPLEYSYYLTAGSVEEIRSRFAGLV
jgi:hypothetical protein